MTNSSIQILPAVRAHPIIRIAGLLLAFALTQFPSTASAATPCEERIYLSGKGPSDAISWDFFCSKGRRSGGWTTIPVPSNWEQHGFGAYNYGHDKPAEKSDETGTYRTKFTIPSAWKEKHVRLVFEGSMSETSIKINGKPVGATNFGGYVPFRFILDKTNIQYGKENTLEVLVKKKPDNDSLDRAERQADYWVFGGIYRPVYLEVQPREFVNRLAIDARADGTLRMDVFPQVQHPTAFREEFKVYADEVTAQVQTLDGVDVGKPMSARIFGGAGRIRMNTKIDRPALWSPEHPNRYQMKVTILLDGKPLSKKIERFGFRTFELRTEDGLYLNGSKIMVQGVNRNVFDAKHGRAVNAEDVRADARAIKAMNANLVRSHLPPTTEFMEACDELGLMVITELTNWHDPFIDTPIARNIAYELVARYQNHPSVILWANGNENGFNLEIDELYHLYDLQDRPVIHPWAYFEGINTKHYPDYKELLLRLGKSQVYLPTEFLHGLYDGGHGAGLEDYWNTMRKSPVSAGGVLWCWRDAAIERTDNGGKLDTAGNQSADGIVGPYGEKEASYDSIREIWSPIQIAVDTLPSDFKGVLPLENRYYEINLNECNFAWRLVHDSPPFSTKAETKLLYEGTLKGPDVAPGKVGDIHLPLTSDWKQADVLELTATSPAGVEIMQWAWSTGKPAKAANQKVSLEQAADKPFEVRLGDSTWSFSPTTGHLLACSFGGKEIGFANGPQLHAGTLDKVLEFPRNWTTERSKQEGLVVIQSKNSDGSTFRWTLSDKGTVALDYSFASVPLALAYCAIGFDLSDDHIASKRWLGQGPHRIWGNRLKGPQIGLWENDYNDNATGVQWGKAEFKGIFGKVDWMQLNLKSGTSLLVTPETATSVGVLRPKNAEETRNEKTFAGPVHAWWHYPEAGGLFLFHKLPGVGTKFANAEELGPQGEASVIPGPITGRVVFQIK